jgi:PST family polysaccharide transporter
MTLEANPESHFDTQDLKVDLRSRSIRGGATTFAAQMLRFVLMTTQSILLARLLSPRDYGVMAMAATITGFVAMFKDFGLNIATVQTAKINHAQVSTLFWINVASGVCLMLITWLTAPIAAWFYSDSRLVPVIMVASCSMPISSAMIQHHALLQRQMRFKPLAIVDLVGLGSSILVALLLAWRGAGYWALVAMALVNASVATTLVWTLCDWRPGRPHRDADVRHMLKFGANFAGSNVFLYFARNLDNILIGSYWGAEQLGLYSRAYSLLMLPLAQINGPIASVAVPTLSRLQDDPGQYRRYYCRAVNVLAYLTMPLIMLLAVTADLLIPTLLGPRWTKAGVLFQVMALGALVIPIVGSFDWLFISLGRTDRMLRFLAMTMVVYVIAFSVGLSWGAIGIASGYAAAALVLFGIQAAYATRRSPLKLTDLRDALMCPSSVTLAAALVAVLVRWQAASLGRPLLLSVTLATGAIAWGAFLLLWTRSRKEAFHLLRLAWPLIASRRTFGTVP